jgi:hypothetical protein
MGTTLAVAILASRVESVESGPPLPVVIAATMFVDAMTELAQQWADGRLGDDLDAVVDDAVELTLALHAKTLERLARNTGR